MDPITTSDLVIYSLASFFAAILNGISGGGGGFIMTPLLIFLGLSPAQAVSTGKLPGLAVAVGSFHGLKAVRTGWSRQLLLILFLSLATGLLAPLVIVKLNGDLYRNMLGILLLVMIPVLVFKKVGHTEHHPSRPKRIAGYGLLVVGLLLQAVFSGGLGVIVNIVLMAFLGMSALESNVTKRYSQILLNGVIVIGILFSGLIVWQFALIGLATAGLGGYVGGRIAVKKGNTFVMGIFIVLMFVSALALLLG